MMKYFLEKRRKGLIVLLTVMMILMNLPYNYQNAKAEELKPQEETPYAKTKVNEKYELINKRTANSKTFVNSKGIFTTEVSQTPIHYQDSTNQWKEINNDLVASTTEEVFQNKSNSMKVKFNQEQEQNSSILEIKENNKSLKMELQPLEHTGEKPKKVKAIVKENYIRYEEVYSNIDINYSVGSDRIKEDILYKKKPTNGFPEKFTYKMDLDGLYIQEINGIIYLYDQVSKQQLYYIDAPYMYDSFLPEGYKSVDGLQSFPEEAVSYDVNLDYEVKDNQIYLNLYPNLAWLKDPNRIYPITIDPTIVRLQSSPYVEDTNIRSGFPTQTGGNDVELGGGSSSGNVIRSLLKFDLASIPASEIVSADLNLWFSSTNGSNPINISLHRMTKEWTENQASWNYAKTVPSTAWITKGGDFISAPFATSTGLTSPGTLDASLRKWEIPVSIVQGWISNRSSNYGVVLKSDTESTNIYKKFISSENTIDGKYHPLLVVSYKAPSRLGLENYWQYSSHPLIGGTSYINLTTGNNILEYKDFNKIKKNEGIEFTRTYNSKSVETSAFGKGWVYTGTDSLLETSDDVIYTESDGTSHYFTYNSVTGTYSSPPGKYLSLKKITVDGVLGYEIKDKYGFKSYFKVYSNQNEQSIKMYRLESTLDTHNNKYLYLYGNSTSNKLVGIKDPSNYTMNIIYDIAGQKIIQVNYRNEKIIYSYNINGQLSTVDKYTNEIKTSTTRYDYNGTGYIEKVINPNGKVTTFTYLNEFLQNIKEESSSNDTTALVTLNKSFEYDIVNKTATVTYPDNTKATFISNDNFVPVKFIHLDGTFTEYKLDSNYNPTEILDSEGISTKNQFDSKGNLIYSLYDGYETNYTFDVNSNVLSENNTDGSVTYRYNQYGDLLEVTDSIEGVTSYSYDLYGSMLIKTSPDKTVEGYDYKVPNNAIETTYLKGTVESYKITKDINGNVIKTEDSNGNVTTSEYGVNNNILSVEDNNHNKIKYVYDSMGRRVSYTDKLGNIENYQYNESNQLTRITDPLSKSITLNYDLNGKINKITYPKGNTVGYAYNENGNLRNILWNNELRWEFAYNSLGLLEKVNNNNGEVINYYYDTDGNLNRETNNNISREYSYTNEGTLSGTKFLINSSQTQTNFIFGTNNTFDKINFNNNEIINYQYDNFNNLTKIQNLNGTNNEYIYNEKGLLSENKTSLNNGEVLSSFSNTYDNNGNIIQIQSKQGIKLYKYDNLNQLISETLDSNHEITYEYDVNGNRIKKNSITNGITQSETYSYDSANQLIAVDGKQFQYDSNGSLINDGEREYIYDQENKLISVRNLTDNKVISFEYDYQGKRTSEIIEGTKKFFYYNGDNIALESNGNEVVAEYFWSADGKPVAMYRNNKMYYYHLNSHGDVHFITDEYGSEVARYDYDAWGNITSKSGQLADINPIRYSGYYYDSATNLYYLGQRYYDPKNGRFITRDTWLGNQNEPITKNKYVYGNNNPIFYIDPSGHIAIAAVIPAAALALLLALAVKPDVIEGVADIVTKVINDAQTYNGRNHNNDHNILKYLTAKRKLHIKRRHFKDYPLGPERSKASTFPREWSEKFIFNKIVQVANKKGKPWQTPKYKRQNNSTSVFKWSIVIEDGYLVVLIVPYNAATGEILSGYPQGESINIYRRWR